MSQPLIIQGGMGVAVSNWSLARTVSRLGQLGVVSGTALALVLARRLQQGDPGGDLREAMSCFPVRSVAERVLADYFVPGGKSADDPFKSVSMPVLEPGPRLVELTVLGSFVEVFLAKLGHANPVGINFLEKIQLPTLPSIYGAMMAGVDYVLMGAGIPRSIPGVLDRFAAAQSASLPIYVEGSEAGDEWTSTFDPQDFCGGAAPSLKRPLFLGIVSSATLAMALAKKANGKVDGFIVEGPTAGGHNAPPRGPLQLTPGGEPVYGPRDVPELDKIRELGLPFWLAGGYGDPERLREAQAVGAAGIQVGTLFAFCEESGILPELKRDVLKQSQNGGITVYTDPKASPTGFPFKVVQMDGTMGRADLVQGRERVCDLGYLRHLYRKTDGTVGYRCPAEPVEDYVRKGGLEEETRGRLCVCNGLPATVGIGQVRDAGRGEWPLVTAGDDLCGIRQFLGPGREAYSAKDVIRYLLGTGI